VKFTGEITAARGWQFVKLLFPLRFLRGIYIGLNSETICKVDLLQVNGLAGLECCYCHKKGIQTSAISLLPPSANWAPTLEELTTKGNSVSDGLLCTHVQV
jgi:hypothetical protein